MELFNLNDYELIYLIGENNEVALNLLYEKYKPFVYMKIRTFHIFKEYIDDFYAEGLMCIHKAIGMYDETRGSSFYSFLDIVVTRRFLRLYSEIVKYDIPTKDLDLRLDDTSSLYYVSNSYFDDGLELMNDKMREMVFKELYLYGLAPRDIAHKYNIDIKKIYNMIQKIKKDLSELKY